MPEEAAERIAEEVHRRAVAIAELREVTAEQSKSIDRLIVAMNHMADAVASRPTRGWVGRFIIGIAVLVLASNGFMFGILWSNQEYLKECTTPSTRTETHTCYEDSRSRTEDAVKAIINSNVYTAQCALNGAADIRKCVNDKLDEVAADNGD